MKWNAIDTKVKGIGRDIVFANGKYYLCHYNPNGIAISDNLKTWTNIEINTKQFNSEKIAYGNGTFIVGGTARVLEGEKETYIGISQDGLNYTFKKLTNIGLNFNLQVLKFVNDRFIMMISFFNNYIDQGFSTSTYIIFETKNGTDIKSYEYEYRSTDDYLREAKDVIFYNGKYVVVGAKGLLMVSSNLKDWTVIETNTQEDLLSITAGKGIFVITGSNGIILTSKDSINWDKKTCGIDTNLIKSRYANGLFIATGSKGSVITSTDAITWSKETIPFKATIYGLNFNDDRYVITSTQYSATKTIPIAFARVSRKIEYASEEALYVFDKNLNLKGVIDGFISLRWRRKYYEAGEFGLVVAPYKNNIDLLKKDNIIIRSDYTEAGIIDTISFNDDGKNVEINCSGSFLLYLTKRRIIKKMINYNGNILDGQKTLLNKMTPLTENFEIEPTTMLTDNIQFQCIYKNVYDFICNLSKISNIGARIVPNIENKVYRFENYKGIDRTHNQKLNERYAFATTQKNVEKLNLTDTSIGNCNYCLVGGSGEGNERILVEVQEGNPTGFDLFESFLDAKSESRDNLTDSEYKESLKSLGLAKLLTEQRSIEVTAYATDYRNKWDLGDIVDIQDENWNIIESLRITEVEEIIEQGKREIKPTFGTPLAEKVSLE